MPVCHLGRMFSVDVINAIRSCSSIRDTSSRLPAFRFAHDDHAAGSALLNCSVRHLLRNPASTLSFYRPVVLSIIPVRTEIRCELSICGRPFQARENVGVVVARGRMLSSVRPLMRQEDSRRPVWEFADRVQITQSVLEALWKALVVPAPSRRLLRHPPLPLALTSSRSWSAYAAAIGVL